MPRSVLTPGQVATDFKTVSQNALVAALLVLCIAFPAHIFNSTLKDNYDEIVRWFNPLHRHLGSVRQRTSELPTPLVLGGLVVASSLLYGFLDPNFGFNQASFALLAGLVGALLVVSGVYDLARAAYLRRTLGISSRLRAYPAGVVIAMLLVIASRLVHFNPGYLFGLFTSLSFQEEMDESADGKGLAVASLWLLLVAVTSWFAWVPIDRAAALDHPGFVVLMLDAGLVTIWVAGVQAIVFGLLPLRFLDGEKIVHWSRAGWGLVYFLGMFLFVHTMLNPGAGVAGAHKAPLTAVVVLFLTFAATSIAFWAYFRFRERPPDAPAWVPPGDYEPATSDG